MKPFFISFFVFLVLSLSSVTAYNISVVDYGSEFVTFNLNTSYTMTSVNFISILKNLSANRMSFEIPDVYVNGSDGEQNRIFGLGNDNLTSSESVIVDNFHLLQNVDYIITHQVANSTIQFINKIWDGQNVMVDFFTSAAYSLLLYDSSFTGAMASGNDGTILRNITLGNTRLTMHEEIVIDNFRLMNGIDYDIVHGSALTNITFINKLWNEQNIAVRYYEVQT